MGTVDDYSFGAFDLELLVHSCSCTAYLPLSPPFPLWSASSFGTLAVGGSCGIAITTCSGLCCGVLESFCISLSPMMEECVPPHQQVGCTVLSCRVIVKAK
jgi:hypothetical protein